MVARRDASSDGWPHPASTIAVASPAATSARNVVFMSASSIDEGNELLHAAAVVRVLREGLDQPALLASRLEVEEPEQHYREREGDRAPPGERPGEGREDDSGVDGVAHDRERAVRDHCRALLRAGEGREVAA